ncbi:hypothetical protein L484_002254 [Morus notabilis]|uniref:Uncharacterized protein n=1 Tax=Morus notabilis TaxID=981085 RepID=W9SGW1_9ROSA|nr:hypothetical protein L484_002254 [Morus notabilis]
MVFEPSAQPVRINCSAGLDQVFKLFDLIRLFGLLGQVGLFRLLSQVDMFGLLNPICLFGLFFSSSACSGCSSFVLFLFGTPGYFSFVRHCLANSDYSSPFSMLGCSSFVRPVQNYSNLVRPDRGYSTPIRLTCSGLPLLFGLFRKGAYLPFIK